MISLVVATINRTVELERFLASLDTQTYRNFEVIVIDQNPDDRLVPVLCRHAGLAISHLRSGRGLSKARNVGLRATKGEIIAIPDDDCWYPPQLLSTVAAWFASRSQTDLLLGITRNADGVEWCPGLRRAPALAMAATSSALPSATTSSWGQAASCSEASTWATALR